MQSREHRVGNNPYLEEDGWRLKKAGEKCRLAFRLGRWVRVCLADGGRGQCIGKELR